MSVSKRKEEKVRINRREKKMLQFLLLFNAVSMDCTFDVLMIFSLLFFVKIRGVDCIRYGACLWNLLATCACNR